MNELLREAAGYRAHDPGQGPEEPPVFGSVGIGTGGAARPPRRNPHDELNAQLRAAAGVIRGHATLDDVI
jgi:hypothetical protein